MPYPEVATHSLRTLDARRPHARMRKDAPTEAKRIPEVTGWALYPPRPGGTNVLEYLLAMLLAPVLRRLIALIIVLSAAAFTASLPVRLLVWMTGSPPDEPMLVTLNAVSLGMLCLFLAWQRRRRRTARGAR